MEQKKTKTTLDKAIGMATNRAKKQEKTQHIYIKGDHIEIMAGDAMYRDFKGNEGEIPQGYIYHGLVHPDGRKCIFTK